MCVCVCTAISNLAVNMHNFEPVLQHQIWLQYTLHNSEPTMHCILLVMNTYNKYDCYMHPLSNSDTQLLKT